MRAKVDHRFGANARALAKLTVEERFMLKVEKQADGCWIWTGAVNKKGYGITRHIRPGKCPVMLASRLSYELFNGPLPDELCACHRCDVPLCVNPSHLFAGTLKDNTKDAQRKGRIPIHDHAAWIKIRAHRRHTRTNAGKPRPDIYNKLSQADVVAMRQEWDSGLFLQKDLAAKYGVTRAYVSEVVNRVYRSSVA